MKHLLVTCMIFSTMGGSLFSQDDPPAKKSSIRLAGGMAIVDYQDLVFSESIYEGSGLGSIELGYHWSHRRSAINAQLSYTATSVAPENLISSEAFGQREESSFLQVALDLNYAYQVIDVSGFRGYAGVNLQAKYQENTMVFGLGEESSYAYLNTLGPHVMLFYSLPEGWELQGRLSLPLAAFLARPEYAVVDNGDIQGKEGFGLLYSKGQLVSLGDYTAIDLSAKLSHGISRRLTGFLAYQFEYQNISIPAPMHLQTSTVKLGIECQL
ncbi:MAG: hypothetical protein AAGA85_20660 [Bacteroidota bacterium]